MAFSFKIAAAPIAGISTRVYREIVRGMGADLPYGEMVCARALVYQNKKTFELLDIKGEQSPRLVQLFGCEPSFMREAAAIAKAAGAEYLDINMGCPVPKIVRNNEGSALMKDPQLAGSLVRAVAEAGLPVCVKMRIGWDEASRNAVDFAKAMENSGAAFVAVHGRTREQMYSGTADWQMIAKVKQGVAIPVIGNGDIFSAADALRMREQTGCDAVMVGRGMLGNPWIFREIEAAFAKAAPPARPSAEEIVSCALLHLREQINRGAMWLGKREKLAGVALARLSEELAVKSMRTHLSYYLKGLRGAKTLRREINMLETYAQIEAMLNNYLQTTTAAAVGDG